MRCLDVGCGGGDVTLDLARTVAPGGRAVGMDIDEVKLEMARAEATSAGVGNVEFRAADVAGTAGGEAFDVVYARFLLTHLPDPASALRNMWENTRPGGVIAVEDIDFTGSFCSPRSDAYDAYVDLYTRTVQARGADPNIGPRLPSLLAGVGCERIAMNVVQPAGIRGEVKLMAAITMENIIDAVLAEKLATEDQVAGVVRQLYELAEDDCTAMSVPRVVQAWGYRPG